VHNPRGEELKMNKKDAGSASVVDSVVKPSFIPLRKEDYKHELRIVNKQGRRAYVNTPFFSCGDAQDVGWWCYSYKKYKGTHGFLLRYEDFKDWRIQV